MPNIFPVITIDRPTGPMSAIAFGMIDLKTFMVSWNVSGTKQAKVRQANYCQLHDTYYFENEFSECPKCKEKSHAE
jgi:hypothetical protein